MINWKAKLTSRKLWMAIVDFVSMFLVAFGVAEDTVTQVAALIMGGAGLVAYIIADGLAAQGTSSHLLRPLQQNFRHEWKKVRENDEKYKKKPLQFRKQSCIIHSWHILASCKGQDAICP